MSSPQVRTQNGSLLLFRLFGVNVFVHWTWALIAFYEINRMQSGPLLRGEVREPLAFYIVEYLGLFLIVLLHEYGHALACKSVGGKAERIVLWPLGGLAYVQPPQRPGATLWSIAAGPLVNVVLTPIFYGLLYYFDAHGAARLTHLFYELTFINIGLLIFNMLPIYPLDGGQILRSLIWFVAGRGMSLMIAAVIGIVGAAGLVVLAVYLSSIWIGAIAAFIGWQSYRSLRVAKVLRQIDKIPRHDDATCPNCGEHPPRAATWRCACGAEFDTFANQATCTQCGKHFDTTACPFCRVASPSNRWRTVNPATTSM